MKYSSNARLIIDMDGTLTRFHDQVDFLERMFEKDFFRNLEPFEKMVEGVRLFMQDHPNIPVYIASAKIVSPYCEEEKNAWLDEHLPEIDQEHRIFTDMGKSKAEYIPGGIGKNDYLLDDYNKGLNLWLYDGGSAIKCHNNINQKGLGAYGGSAGSLWTGNMVHTDDSPQIIAAELASHMGLGFELHKVIDSAKEKIHYKEFTPGSKLDPDPFKPGINAYLTRVLADKYNPERYEATYTAPYYKMDYKNPLNAIRWLEGKADFYEYQLQCNDGTKLFVPSFQAEALAMNLYGCPLNKLMEHGKNYKSLISPDIADSFLLAMENANLPTVGRIHYLGSNGEVGETAIFYDVQQMREEISECENCGRPIRADWLVQPYDVTLYCSPDMGAPEIFTISRNNLLKAAELCGFPIDDIEEFICEYTWAESASIWQEYGQYIDKIAEIMEGFGSRREVEKEFYSIVDSGCSPVDATQLMLSNIEQWASWDNQEAVQAGVLDKAIEYRQSLSGKQPQKSSLDAKIFSANQKQGSGGHAQEAQLPKHPNPEKENER